VGLADHVSESSRPVFPGGDLIIHCDINEWCSTRP